MAYPERMSTETSLADYPNLSADFGFMENNVDSSNYDQVFDSAQSTFYESHHSRSSSSNFEAGPYHPDTSQLLQQQQQQAQQKPSGQYQSGNLDPLSTSRMGGASDDLSNWPQPRLQASTTSEELSEHPNMNSFQLTQTGINSSASTELSSWGSFEKEQVRDSPQQQQQQQQTFNNMGWGQTQMQHPSRNVNPMSPAGSVVMGTFPAAFHHLQGQSQQFQQSQEEMKSRSTSHSDNSLSVASTEGGDIQQGGGHRRRMSISSGLQDASVLQHQGDTPGAKNVSVALMDFENNLAAKLRKPSPQQIPVKQQQQQLEPEMVHTHTGSWDGASVTAESVMVSSSPPRRGSNGFQSSQLRDMSSSPTPVSTAPLSVLQQQQQQQQMVPQADPKEYSNQQERGLLLVNLLVGCADAVANNNQGAAMSLLNDLSQMVSPHGDSIQRVASYFTYGLLAHIANTASTGATPCRIKETTTADTLDALQAFSKVCPFMRFGEVAAIQSTLEAFQGKEDVHWIDLGMVPGSLWLSYQLIQALAARNGGPPKMIHFTGVQVTGSTGCDDQTGRQLKEFADKLHLNFIFQPVPVERLENLKPWMFTSRPGQAVAVNCSAKLHTLLYDDGNCLNHVLAMIHHLGPKVFCILEQEATHNVPTFLARFLEALHFYSAIFDSLEATLPRVSPERAKVEQLLLGQEIINIVSREGKERVERHERFQHWRSRMAKAGFLQLPLSEPAVARVKSLRCITYGIGFAVLEDRGSLILQWQDRPLFTSSAWST